MEEGNRVGGKAEQTPLGGGGWEDLSCRSSYGPQCYRTSCWQRSDVSPQQPVNCSRALLNQTRQTRETTAGVLSLLHLPRKRNEDPVKAKEHQQQHHKPHNNHRPRRPQRIHEPVREPPRHIQAEENAQNVVEEGEGDAHTDCQLDVVFSR